jgi:hypothetical protein
MGKGRGVPLTWLDRQVGNAELRKLRSIQWANPGWPVAPTTSSLDRLIVGWIFQTVPDSGESGQASDRPVGP